MNISPLPQKRLLCMSGYCRLQFLAAGGRRNQLLDMMLRQLQGIWRLSVAAKTTAIKYIEKDCLNLNGL
ncbi:hypothetical protein F7734_44215 [Scytonema sp. UIC 10036]|uniref:hypothetical protein n=1 Tax=Scytonema sp. UIC 10036 TaxID=2304196 RepID=UPI0012DA99E8|nr:hypothetical protein [Scytonema sp. UIC 10036]MUG98932.1 hypothetical protein [Scytonema sp. UIC 10036]